MVQPVQSAHVVAPPGSNHAALSVHHHTDDSSTAHVVGLAGVQGRRVPGRVDSGREAGGVDNIKKGEEPKFLSYEMNTYPSVDESRLFSPED